MYSKIDTMFWKDLKNKTLTDDEKLMFLYILTCPHKNMLGLFELPIAYIEADLGWNSHNDRVSDRVCNTLFSLCNKGYVLYDNEMQIILIKNYLKYNPLESSKQMIGAAKLLPEIPITKLEKTLISILLKFKDDRKSKEFNSGIDTLCNTLSDRLKDTLVDTSNSNCNSINNSNSNTTTTTIDNNLNNIDYEEEKKETQEEVIVVEDEVIDFYDKNIDKITDYSRLFIAECREKRNNRRINTICYAISCRQQQKDNFIHKRHIAELGKSRYNKCTRSKTGNRRI